MPREAVASKISNSCASCRDIFSNYFQILSIHQYGIINIGIGMNHQPGIGIGMNVHSGIGIGMVVSVEHY